MKTETFNRLEFIVEWIVGAKYKTRDGREAILEFDGGPRDLSYGGQTLLFSINGQIEFHYDDGLYYASGDEHGRDIISRITTRPLTPDELADTLTHQWIHDSENVRVFVSATRKNRLYLNGPNVDTNETMHVSAAELLDEGWTFNGKPIGVTE